MKIIIIVLMIVLTGCKNEGNIIKNTSENPLKNSFFSQKSVRITETLVGEASTQIIDNGKNRVENIKIACEKISGLAIKSGETFSFNRVTGKKSRENGYKNAPVLVDGEKSYGIGGGVCQVSTTIYIAAKNGGLEVVEHHNHTKPVSYVAKGMDATVVYGVKDLKIKNNTNETIYIYTWIEDEKVFAKIIKKSIDIE